MSARRAASSRVAAGVVVRLGRWAVGALRTASRVAAASALAALGILFLNYVVLSTDKARAYRDLDPNVAECRDGLARGWTILADTGRETLQTAIPSDGDGWVDASNDEGAVVAADARWGTRLRCALQRHVVPARAPGGRDLAYHLGFIEFQEDGEPYALVSREGAGDAAVDSAMLRHAMDDEMRAKGMPATMVKPVITQLDALKKHLAHGSHYVIAFVHGWRHDARIGDGNVADLRLYAAHAARFLAQRCPDDPSVCDMDVTAIYVGWRGARVDERGLRTWFGDAVGGFFGGLSAGATLFDRKPVSEAIAPGAISALRTIETTLSSPGAHNKLIVAGHSLGGNMLATGLQDDVVKAVRRHRFGEALPPVLGNLVVLINPASEASKWTAIQREVWSHLADHADAHTPASEVVRDDGYFPADQRPVLMSVTAALAFPAGGLRPGDCAWIGLDVADGFAAARKRIRSRLAATDRMFDAGVDYDWATHDLFPTFKFDFRPAAGFLDRVAARFEGRPPRGETCTPAAPVGLGAGLATLPVRTLSLLAATFPFQNTAREDSHTIGNLDPPRPAAGVLADAQQSAAPFGTTHELMGLDAPGLERHHPYATLADAAIDCPRSDRWLTRARLARADRRGNFWDSTDLAPRFPQEDSLHENEPAARFLHGLQLTGIAPITRPNDPFWNVRAFDNALSRHDGYRLSSFICALNQLVMDDITDAPAAMSDHQDVPGR
ncbi:hypothetical protein AFCDBAGC_3991 [Methylobacterium cerastii]|uniref:Uncharacterized protein n=1 Tax=Methylobacterium cerastii TaxID=932741 RepID=A0ABQ4QLJ1_9HYPH|nr:hypothetical protein [Methylobacterium cerastii]GJD46111.1 hypothetical protein AFCDBAGC_3991 [Methylobacterium cerastii]